MLRQTLSKFKKKIYHHTFLDPWLINPYIHGLFLAYNAREQILLQVGGRKSEGLHIGSNSFYRYPRLLDCKIDD